MKSETDEDKQEHEDVDSEVEYDVVENGKGMDVDEVSYQIKVEIEEGT